MNANNLTPAALVVDMQGKGAPDGEHRRIVGTTSTQEASRYTNDNAAGAACEGVAQRWHERARPMVRHGQVVEVSVEATAPQYEYNVIFIAQLLE